MDVSKFLAKVIGIYFLIVSIAVLVNMPQFITYVNNLLNDTPVMFLSGFYTLVLGILMVVSHNIWTWNWRVIITIIGWITLIKGASIIYYPQFIDHLSMLFVQDPKVAYGAAIIDLIFGLLLIYCGFKRD